jgi:DNA topoisomerase I
MLSEVNSIMNACNGKDGVVSQIKVRKIVPHPPTPLNLSDLQKEIYRLFKLSPSYLLSIAESLYQCGDFLSANIKSEVAII